MSCCKQIITQFYYVSHLFHLTVIQMPFVASPPSHKQKFFKPANPTHLNPNPICFYFSVLLVPPFTCSSRCVHEEPGESLLSTGHSMPTTPTSPRTILSVHLPPPVCNIILCWNATAFQHYLEPISIYFCLAFCTFFKLHLLFLFQASR